MLDVISQHDDARRRHVRALTHDNAATSSTAFEMTGYDLAIGARRGNLRGRRHRTHHA